MVETNTLKKLKEELKSYEDMVPVNNMGKWSRSVAIENYTKKIAKIEHELESNRLKNNEHK
jgi:hypothetical protein